MDDKKIAYALSWLHDGLVGPWTNLIIDQMNCAKHDPTNPWPFANWAACQTAFLECFADPEECENTTFRLNTISQGCQTVDEFVAELCLLTGKAGYKGNILKDLFNMGVDVEIACAITLMIPAPDNFKSYVQAALTIDQNVQALYHRCLFVGRQTLPSSYIP